MICPNCFSLKVAAAAYRGYAKCYRCGVYFLPGHTEQELSDYYSSGEYRNRNQQRDEVEHQTRRAKHVIQYIGSPTVFIDVGSSLGILMDAVQEKTAARCYGVDIDPVLAKNMYSDINHVQEQADCITLIHTLEHILSPLALLLDVRAKLNEGGRVIVEVPNGDTNAGGRFYASAFAFPHVTMFDSQSLSWTMRAAGFSEITMLIHGRGGLLKAPEYYYLLAVGSK